MVNRNKQNHSLSEKVEAALLQVEKRVVLRARQTGTPVVVWDEGHVKEVPSDQIEMAAENDEDHDERHE